MPVYLRKSLQNMSLPMNLLPYSPCQNHKREGPGQAVITVCESNTPHRLELEGEKLSSVFKALTLRHCWKVVESEKQESSRKKLGQLEYTKRVLWHNHPKPQDEGH